MTPKHEIEKEAKIDAPQNTPDSSAKEADEGRVVVDSLVPLKNVEKDTTIASVQKDIDAVKQDIHWDSKEISNNTTIEKVQDSTKLVTDKTVEEFDTHMQEQEKKSSSEKKSLVERTGDFLKEYKKPLLIGWGIVWCFLLYKRRRKKQKAKEAATTNNAIPENKDNRSVLWKVWDTIKWPVMIAWWYYWAHGLYTGKWGLDKLFDWNKEKDLQDDKDKVDAYKDAIEKDPVAKETFEWLWNATDALYTNLFAKELADGWQDDADMETISQKVSWWQEKLKWVVPWCISEENASIDAILDDKEQSMSFLNASVEQIKNKVWTMFSSGWGALWSFLVNWFSFSAGKDAFLAKLAAWGAEAQEAAWQVKFFYREKVRLQTFLLYKEKALIEKIATEKAAWQGTTDTKDIGDLIKDMDWLKDNVHSDPRYTAYRSGNLKNAYETLQKNGLMDGSIDKETQEIVKELDADRDDTLDFDWKKSVLQRANDDIMDGVLDQKNKDTLLHVTTKINKELQWEFIDVAKDSAWNVYSELFDGDEKAKRTFLQETGMDALWRTITDSLGVYAAKIANRTITASEMQDFNFLVNSFYAFKKEVYAGANTLQYIHNPDGSWTVKAWDFFWGQLLNLGTACKKALWGDFKEAGVYVLSAIPLIAVSAYGIALVHPATARKTWVATGKFGIAGVEKLAWFAKLWPARVMTAGSWTAKQFGWKVYGKSWALRQRFYSGVDWADKLITDFERQKISLSKAWEVYESGSKVGFKKIGEKVRNSWTNHADDVQNFKRYLVKEKFLRKTHLPVYENAIKNNIDTIVAYYDMPVFEKMMNQKWAKYDEVIALMKKVENMETTLSGNKKLLFEALMQHRAMSAAKAEKIMTYIDKIDDTILVDSKIAKYADSLIHTSSSLESAVHINEHIKALQAWEKTQQAAKTAVENAARIKTEAELTAQQAQAEAERLAKEQVKTARTQRMQQKLAENKLRNWWKDAKWLWLTEQSQKALHTSIVDDVSKLEALQSTLVDASWNAINKWAVAAIEKDISALKECATNLSKLSGQEANALIEATKTVKLPYLAKIMQETDDIAGLMKELKNVSNPVYATWGLIWDAAGSWIIKWYSLWNSELESVLKNRAPKFLEDLRWADKLDDFARTMEVVVADGSKISKIEKAALLLGKIVTKIR